MKSYLAATHYAQIDLSIHLSCRDISVDSHFAPTYIAVNIKVSKTDPFRQGVMIYLG